jgi:hypothetical protein
MSLLENGGINNVTHVSKYTGESHISSPKGGCKLGATGLEDFLALHELHKVHEFNGCFDPQCDLQLIADAKRGFIKALH